MPAYPQRLHRDGCFAYNIRLSNHSVEANRRPAAPLEAGSQFGLPFSAPPDYPAAVAHLCRWALLTSITQ